MASGPESKNTNPGKETPDEFDIFGDARGRQGSGEYPNYWGIKDRSGNSFQLDSSEGNESITLQHRGGSAVQFHPDGSLHITAHNGKYQITFGEDRMTISGAQDITVKGDASLRVYGDYNVTCHKNYNLSVMGDINIVGKNMNRHIRGNMDTQAKNVNKKIEGSISYQAQGAQAYVSKGAATVASMAQTTLTGAKGLLASVPGDGNLTMSVQGSGNMYQQVADGAHNTVVESSGSSQSVGAAGASKKVSIQHKDGSTSHNNSNDYKKKVEGDHTETTTGDHTVTSTTGGIQMKTEAGSISTQSQQNIEIKSQQDTHVISQGHAAIEGSAGTTVGNATGLTNIVGGAGGINLDPLAGLLNLAGGGGVPFAGLAQLAFNFLQADEGETPPEQQTTRANQPQEEADASSWINALDRTA